MSAAAERRRALNLWWRRLDSNQRRRMTRSGESSGRRLVFRRVTNLCGCLIFAFLCLCPRDSPPTSEPKQPPAVVLCITEATANSTHHSVDRVDTARCFATRVKSDGELPYPCGEELAVDLCQGHKHAVPDCSSLPSQPCGRNCLAAKSAAVPQHRRLGAGLVCAYRIGHLLWWATGCVGCACRWSNRVQPRGISASKVRASGHCHPGNDSNARVVVEVWKLIGTLSFRRSSNASLTAIRSRGNFYPDPVYNEKGERVTRGGIDGPRCQ